MKAIDVHCHLATARWACSMAPYNEAMREYYRTEPKIVSEAEMAAELVAADVKAMIIAWDTESADGCPRTPNEYVAQLAKDHPEAFIGSWAMIDPWRGRMAIEELERCVRDLGMSGLKCHPICQKFWPNDRRFYPLWERCQELGVPVQFHTGTTGVGAGMKGGMGVQIKYGNPMALDDVAAEFPDLTIIGCHVSWPWQSEMIAVLLHKANVFLELSGWSPKYFPDELKREIRSRLHAKCMFGSDYPVLSHERLFRDYAHLNLSDAQLEDVWVNNAVRILGLRL